ncbi:MAG TPA: DUF6671 family protein [Azospirillaceae bacterium]|nr:DUF6671 family protein [Azospirillaceae bacterium]
MKLAVATMHGKAGAIAPAFAPLGFDVFTPDIDTDALGTFTGEVPRPAGPKETAVLKARLGAEAAGVRFAVASEGSYRPKPEDWGGPVRNAEVLAFVDMETGLELVEAATDVPSRFAMARVRPDLEDPGLREVLAAIGFPDHAVLVAQFDGRVMRPVFKALRTREALVQALRICAEAGADGLVHVESDMRAHLNPTRMAAIASVARRLAGRVAPLVTATGVWRRAG